jgi:prepilin-type N-terminal cleavage/methylation domain-containing protein
MTFSPHLNSARGFTLLETVIVILLLAIASAGIINLNGGLFTNASQIRNLQINTQLLQACAERVMAVRRLSGFIDVPDYDTVCEALPLVASGSNKFTVTTTLNYTGSSCPIGATCQWVDIRVNNAVGEVGPITLQLMKY